MTTTKRIYSRRPIGVRFAVAAIGGLVVLSGCSEEAQQAFRGAASSGLQQGLSSLLNGLVDGAFAVFDLGADGSGADGGSTTGDSTTDTSGGQTAAP